MIKLKISTLLTVKMEELASILSMLVLNSQSTETEKRNVARKFLNLRQSRNRMFGIYKNGKVK